MAREKENVFPVLEVVKATEEVQEVKEPVKDTSKISNVRTSTDLKFFHGDRWYVFNAGETYKVTKVIRDRLVELKVLEAI